VAIQRLTVTFRSRSPDLWDLRSLWAVLGLVPGRRGNADPLDISMNSIARGQLDHEARTSAGPILDP
jgi:hypothetical protein